MHASHEDDRGVIASEGRVTTRDPRDESVPLQLLLAAACITGEAQSPRSRLPRALAAARAVNAGEVAAGCAGDKARIPQAVHAARVTAVAEEL